MKIGVLFPGYGSQYTGMAKELYDKSRTVQEYFEQASQCVDINFVKLFYASSETQIDKIDNAYPAIFLLGISITQMITKNLDISFDLVSGYGSGEYSALCASGGLSFADGLYLLKKLSHFYTAVRQELDVKTVVIDGLSAKDVKQICKEHSSENNIAQISVYSKDSEHFVSGHTNAIDKVVESAFFKGSERITFLEIEEALHTPILKGMLEQLKLYLTKVDFTDLKIPMVSCVNSKEISSARAAQNVILSQIVKPIYWKNVLKKFGNMDIIIVPSPSKILVQEIKLLYSDKTVIGIETLEDIQNLKSILADYRRAQESQESINTEQVAENIASN